MRPKVKAWVAFGDELKFGDGRARLLELIDKRGSLFKAAREFEMSYRKHLSAGTPEATLAEPRARCQATSGRA